MRRAPILAKAAQKVATPDVTRQLGFQQVLAAARKTYLHEALADAASAVDPKALKAELAKYIPAASAKVLAKAGIRDEEVFAVPVILKQNPMLLGYYRLLLGVGQKGFYTTDSGRRQFWSMERSGKIGALQAALLGDLCRALAEAGDRLTQGLSPAVTRQDVAQLPLLTFGAQLYGSNNNDIGKAATLGVFVSIRDIVKAQLMSETATKLVVKNAAGRAVEIVLASDPDVRVTEMVGVNPSKKLAIEIKGGTDASNAYNRAGEAEKSHTTAKADGFLDFWTIIAKKGVSLTTLTSKSGTTREWFDVSQVLGRTGPDWDSFKDKLKVAVGIP